MSIRESLELVYFISGPLIVIVAIIGLNQIRIAKRDIAIRSKREATELAALQCQAYYGNVIPKMNDLDLYMREKKFEIYSGKPFNFDFDEIQKNNQKWCRIVIPETCKDVDFVKRITSSLNALDGFSVFFVKRIADEGVAFSSVGFTFCNSVRDLAPFIAIVRDSQHRYYDNVVELYKIWSARIEKGGLESQMESISTRLSSICDNFIKPLGTEGKDK